MKTLGSALGGFALRLLRPKRGGACDAWDGVREEGAVGAVGGAAGERARGAGGFVADGGELFGAGADEGRAHGVRAAEDDDRVGVGDGKDTQFKVLVGRIRAFVQKLRPANKFEVRTPVAAAAVRGTVFDMDVSEDTSSRLSVLEGAVNYRDLAGLAKEIEVLKGQTVLIPRGQAPRPPEMMPKDLMQGAVGHRERVRREIFVEKRQDDRREGFQEEAADGQKEEQYQLGRAAVDAFGRRVRIEEFILRPAPESYAYVVVNHRDGGQTFSRLDVVASAALPARLEGLNLFNKLAPQNLDPLTLYAKSTHFLASNGQDYYREWRSGGDPRNLSPWGEGLFRKLSLNIGSLKSRGRGKRRNSSPTGCPKPLISAGAPATILWPPFIPSTWEARAPWTVPGAIKTTTNTATGSSATTRASTPIPMIRGSNISGTRQSRCLQYDQRRVRPRVRPPPDPHDAGTEIY
jgi:hypothetical protein